MNTVGKGGFKGFYMKVSVLLIVLMLWSHIGYAQAGDIVISLGGDLNSQQRMTILEHFGVDEAQKDEIKLLEVHIHEEYEYLGDIAGPEIIGNKTMSSIYLEVLPEGDGVHVETHNITWVTKEMYASALVTAGVQDVLIKAAAPFPVSGTGALTGVLKAFEEVTGEPLTEENKRVAHEELVILTELTEIVDDSDLSNQLIQRAKEEILRNRPLDYEEIEEIVQRIARELDVSLSPEQLERIVRFLEKFNDLEIDLEQLTEQISRFFQDPDNRSFIVRAIQQVLDLVREFIDRIRE